MTIFKKDDSKKVTMDEMTGKNPVIINNDDSNPADDTISLVAVQELLKDKKTTSRVKMEQVKILTKLYLFSSVFGTTVTKKLADNILQLQVSINGLGRKELVQLVQRRNDMTEGLKPLTSKDIFR